MSAHAVLIVDPNPFRASAYSALLAPWACRADAELSAVTDLADAGDVSDFECLITILCIGAASLRDVQVADAIARHREMFGTQPLIVVSDRFERQEIAAAIEAGLRGFIPTTMHPHVALAAIQFIMAGGTYLPHSPLASPRQPHTSPPAAPMASDAGSTGHRAGMTEPLKQRHVEVLAGLRQGHTNKVIGRHLDLTEATVKLYVRQLMKIFDAKNRTELALKAAAHPQLVGAGADAAAPEAAPVADRRQPQLGIGNIAARDGVEAGQMMRRSAGLGG